jgi:hypothetical protein
LRYTTTAVRDSERLAEQEGSVPSIDTLDFVMESETLGHEVMDQQQGHEVLLQVSQDGSKCNGASNAVVCEVLLAMTPPGA